jgi:hypothetical protein
MNQASVSSAQPLKRRRTATQPQPNRTVLERTKSQDQLLCLALSRKELREYLSLLTLDMFVSTEAAELFEFLRNHPEFSGAGDNRQDELRPLETYVKILAVQYEELYQGLELTELRYEAARLQARLVETYVKDQKQQLAAQLRDADERDAEQLLIKVKDYDALLKRVTGGM